MRIADQNIFADVIDEPLTLTAQQSALVDAFFTNGFNKTQAFKTAGYKCSNPEKLGLRVNQTFRSPQVLNAIAQRRAINSIIEVKQHTPLEVMIDNMEYWYGIATDPAKAGTAEAHGARMTAQDCAREAAPYMHPKLQAIAVSGRIRFEDLKDEQQLDTALSDLRRALEKDGVVFDNDGRPIIDGVAQEVRTGAAGADRGKPRKV